jgi:hypothetical protein
MATFKYRIVERAFKEGQVLDPNTPPVAEDNPQGLFVSQEVYVSRALVPADEATTKAVAALKEEHDAHYNKAAPISSEEAASLREEVGVLKAQLADAIGALKQAAKQKQS